MAPPRPDLRRRAIAFAAAVATIALGLASRRYAEALPDFIAAYAGDTLWALVVYLIATALVPSTSILRRALAALAFAFAIEASQLYHAPWIEEIRANRLAALVVGSGLHWNDHASYALGVAHGAAGEAHTSRPMRRV